jgi:hypothetical protein
LIESTLRTVAVSRNNSAQRRPIRVAQPVERLNGAVGDRSRLGDGQLLLADAGFPQNAASVSS